MVQLSTGPPSRENGGTAAFEDVTKSRNLNDIHGGLNGGDYGAWFPLTALAAVGFSVVIAAVRMRFVTRSDTGDDSEQSDGFGSLSRMDWFSALRTSWSKLRKTVWGDLALLLRESPDWSLPKIVARRWLDD